MATREPGSGPGDLFTGLTMPIRGIGLLLSSGRLAGLAALPMALTALCAFLTAGALAMTGDRLVGLVWPKPGTCDGCGFFGRLWAWIEVGAWHAAWFVVAALLTMAIAIAISRVATAPLMDLLARDALRKLNATPPPGTPVYGDLPLAKAVPLSILRAAGRGGVLLAGLALLFAISLVPGGAFVATPLGFAWTTLWLFVDTMLYPVQWVGDASLDEVRAVARTRPWLMAGFALATGLLMLIPLAAILVTPAAVAAACLVVARSRNPA